MSFAINAGYAGKLRLMDSNSQFANQNINNRMQQGISSMSASDMTSYESDATRIASLEKNMALDKINNWFTSQACETLEDSQKKQQSKEIKLQFSTFA